MDEKEDSHRLRCVRIARVTFGSYEPLDSLRSFRIRNARALAIALQSEVNVADSKRPAILQVDLATAKASEFLSN